MSAHASSGDGRRASLGAVLAGGRSSRMGAPKAGLELAGRPLVSYAVDAVAAGGLAPVVVAKEDSRLPEVDCRIVREADPRPHPGAGILAALEAAGGPVVVVACDMPFVPAQLVAVLAQLSARTAVPMLDGRLQPLLARYGPGVAPGLEGAVERRERLREAVRALDPVILGRDELAGFGNPEWIAYNVNDPRDLAAAERRIAPAPGR